MCNPVAHFRNSCPYILRFPTVLGIEMQIQYQSGEKNDPGALNVAEVGGGEWPGRLSF